MSNTPFKTPLSHGSVSHRDNNGYLSAKTNSDRSDSEESTTSESSSGISGSSSDLNVVALFDDLMRLIRHQNDETLEDALIEIGEEAKMLICKYSEALNECQRLQMLLDQKTDECSEHERRMFSARNILDEEKRKTYRVMMENEELHHQLDTVRELVFKNTRIRFNEEEREKFSFLQNRSELNGNNHHLHPNLSCINEVNSTGSLLSDLSVSRSEDDLDVSFSNKTKARKRRDYTGVDELKSPKKRRSSAKFTEIGDTETVRTTTTVTVNKKGPITATSIIESVPATNNYTNSNGVLSTNDGAGSGPFPRLVVESWNKTETPKKNQFSANINLRPHVFEDNLLVFRETCNVCERKTKIGKVSAKCKDCKAICHLECKIKLALPCIPIGITPDNRKFAGIISDYTPSIPPIVPALIIHCVNEIELRGTKELGLYRLSASEKEVKTLKEKFLKGRGAPSLTQVDIHTICACIKDFIRSLTEPLVTYALWHDFVNAIQAKNPEDVAPALCQCISELPRPNRDTLAYLMLHLQKVAEWPECKMPIENLSKVFGPTLIGFSTKNPNTDDLKSEMHKQIAIAEQLLRLPSDYWASFINIPMKARGNPLEQTSSTDSLQKLNGIFFSPRNIRSSKKKQIFHTPPAYRVYNNN